MLAPFLSFAHAHQLLPQNSPTLLTVSGGVDSVVMSDLFQRAGLRFAVAHCNFGLRGEDSNQDEVLVRTLAERYNVNFYRKSFHVRGYSEEKGISTQMAARALCYAWFQELCKAHGFEKVATAHHGNDSLETVLLHLTKGTGIAGLRGILPARGRYIRPLLFSNKAEILAYAEEQGLSWREDSSNQKNTYQRNLIRNKVVPCLRAINPNLESTFQLTAERLGQVEALFNEQVATIRQQIGRQEGADFYIDITTIQDKPWAPVVAWEILKPFGFNFVQAKGLLTQQPPSGAMEQSASHQLYVDRMQWIVTPTAELDAQSYTITSTTKFLPLPQHALHCAHIPSAQYKIITSKEVAALDREKLHFPLIVSRWQPGDAFYPLGMQQRKKLSDFFIDNKVPIPLKARVWVVTSGGEIVWVVGHRIDDRFKITASTREVYEIRKV